MTEAIKQEEKKNLYRNPGNTNNCSRLESENRIEDENLN